VSIKGGTATAAAFPPLAASMYFAGMPWYGCVLLGVVAMATYMSRQYWLFRLGCMAIEKAAAARVPELMAALTGEGGRSSVRRTCGCESNLSNERAVEPT
jgi:hypothetical protein